VIPFGFRFVLGPLPSDAEFAAALAPSATEHPWLRDIYRKHFGESGKSAHRLIDLCERCDTIDLWIDPDPNAQLILVWLLECFRPHDAIVSKLNLVQTDISIGELIPERLLARRFPVIKIAGPQLELASSAWRAWRRQSPQHWLGLLSEDLCVLPQLRPAVVALLDELPRSS
jgi:hypothetical protein